MEEEEYYPRIEKFLKKEFDCFATRSKVGDKYVGYADVLGIRDIGGRYSNEIEVVSVEVKKWPGSFGKILGQALGYSLFSHKCYLAIPMRYSDKFTQDHREMANRLGVGLIEIKSDHCKEIVTSQHHNPIETLLLRTLENVGYFKCSLCRTLTKVGEDGWTEVLSTATNENKDKTFYYSRRFEERELLFTKAKDPSRWIMICKICIQKLKLDEI